jgi:hypothetical protein
MREEEKGGEGEAIYGIFNNDAHIFVHKPSGTCANTNDLIFKVIRSGTINYESQQRLIH